MENFFFTWRKSCVLVFVWCVFDCSFILQVYLRDYCTYIFFHIGNFFGGFTSVKLYLLIKYLIRLFFPHFENQKFYFVNKEILINNLNMSYAFELWYFVINWNVLLILFLKSIIPLGGKIRLYKFVTKNS